MEYEYKVIEAKSAKDAQLKMNEYAKDGWRVISTAFLPNLVTSLMITFEREKKE